MPAPPVNSGEPLSTMPKRLPPSTAGRILLRRCSRKSREPSRHPRQAGTEAAIEALRLMFFADFLFDLLPLDAEGRIGEHVVELLVGVTIVGEGVAEDDVGDILPLDEHVGFADRVGLSIQFLAEHGEPRLRVVLRQIFARHGEHAARARRRVIDRADDAGFGQHVVILDEEQIDHEPDDFARSEMFSGGFVRDFGELADQLLEDQAHLAVADLPGWRSILGKLLSDLIEQAGFGEAFDLSVELEALKDVADRRRERLDVG